MLQHVGSTGVACPEAMTLRFGPCVLCVCVCSGEGVGGGGVGGCNNLLWSCVPSRKVLQGTFERFIKSEGCVFVCAAV